ncbi:MAG: glycosyl transferase family protein [Pseudomonadota bacterium]
MLNAVLLYPAAYYYTALEWTAAVVAVLIMLSSLDDLFIDGYYWTREIIRALTIKRAPSYTPLSQQTLREHPEKPIAIMVPAWMEANVIAMMLDTMVGALEYRNYRIFVGTYPNDRATIEEVERMKRRFKQLQRVEVPHDGPTCKADCLNWVVQAIFLYEQQHDMEFSGVVLHDCEDVIHPLELHLFNYLVHRKELVQIPVMSLERNWFELVAGTYMDEFAEWHSKDLPVRESLSGMVPSAGVGTCFSRTALLALCEETNNQPFNTDSLTEDYDIGLRLTRKGMKSIFVRFPVQYRVVRKHWFSAHDTQATITMPMCVREFFPDTFRAAYRQKARWTLGIALQSWVQLGWPGSWATKYLLFRDRKSIVTSLVSIFAYFVLLNFLGFFLAAELGYGKERFPPLFSNNPFMSFVLFFNFIALSLRVVQRVYFVGLVYGWQQGLLALPRMVVANAVNFMAAARAWKLFIGSLLFGTRVTWDKTTHAFPTTHQLAKTRTRIGELLRSWQAVDEAKLDQALDDQPRTQMPLGRLLVSRGWLDDDTLAEALAAQEDMPRVFLSAEKVREHGGGLPLALSVRHRCVALGTDPTGRLRIAVGGPLAPDAVAELTQALGASPVLCIARESEIAAALRMLTGGSETFGTGAVPPLLGDVLIEQGLVTRQAFDAAMSDYHPERDGRIGEHLLHRGVVTAEALHAGLERQRALTAA